MDTITRAACITVIAGMLISVPDQVRADHIYDDCIETSDGSNPAWGDCGQQWVEREDEKLNASWKRLNAKLDGQTKIDLLAEQRAWNANVEPIGPEGADVLAPRYFNGRKMTIYGGSSEVQRGIMSKVMLGL